MYSSKIFVSEGKYKNNLKNREYQKKKYFTVLIFIMFMPCFTTKSRGFTKILPRSVLSSRSENTGPVTRYHVKSSQMRKETPLQLLKPEHVQYFYFLEAKFINVFRMR